MHAGFWWGNVGEGDHVEDPGLDERLKLKWIFEKSDGAWIGSIWLRMGMVACRCECGNEPFGFIGWGGRWFLYDDVLGSQEGLCSVELVISYRLER